MRKKKLVALGMVAALATTAVVGGSLAYFTDKDSAENVFTVGNIDIDLREWKDMVDGNEFEDIDGIMPGMSYNKIVDVKNIGDNDAFVRVEIVIPEDMTPVWNENLGDDWLEDTNNPQSGSGTYVFTLKEKLAPNATTAVLLEKVTLNGDVTELTAESSYKVSVTAEAIQADGFEDGNGNGSVADEAYAALSAAVKPESVANADELNKALETKQVVILTDDIDAETDIVMAQGAVIDGNGKALNKEKDANGGINAGVATVGGTIKNITISGESVVEGEKTKGFRAIYAANGIKENLVIEDATLSGTYALNITGASSEHTLTVKKSTLNGWTSYAPLAGATFDEVNFGEAAGQKNLKPYADTVLNKCNFVEGFKLDAGAAVTINFKDCTVNGTSLDANNFATLFTLLGDEKLPECTIVVNGTTVDLTKVEFTMP